MAFSLFRRKKKHGNFVPGPIPFHPLGILVNRGDRLDRLRLLPRVLRGFLHLSMRMCQGKHF